MNSIITDANQINVVWHQRLNDDIWIGVNEYGRRIKCCADQRMPHSPMINQLITNTRIWLDLWSSWLEYRQVFFFGNSNFSPGISFLDGAFPSAFWRNGKRFEWHETGARRRRSFPRRFGPSPRACAIIRPGHFCPAFVTYSGRSRGASSKFIPSNIRASNLARPDEFYISNIEKKKKRYIITIPSRRAL